MSDYQAENITVLEGLEAVRKRPGMYIGNTGKEGLHRCLGEIMDNSVDEFMAGHGDTIRIVIHKDYSVTVSDNGRGIPTDIHPKTGKPALETIMTTLHAGGKFDQKNYQFSGGLHGVGASVVNALSDYMKVWVLRNNKVERMFFEKGKTVTEGLETVTVEDFKKNNPGLIEEAVWEGGSGTIIKFLPDKTIFELSEFDPKEIELTLKQTAYLNKGLKIIFVDEKSEKEVEYHFPKGIVTYLEDMSDGSELVTPIIHFEGKIENFELELALAYSSKVKEKFYPFTNGIYNSEGGMHVTGFRSALTKLINNYANQKGYFKKSEKLTSEDLKEGLHAVLSIRMVDPQFTSQSKVKLGSTRARTLTDKIISEHLGAFLEENPKVSQSIIAKAQLAMKARIAARAARENVMRKGVLESSALPGKLADCASKNPEESEIFIVEGDSAGGSAKQGRDRHSQAILPLRGKVLNTEKATLDRILNYEGIKNMIIGFGAGIGDHFDIEKLRYHKIIIMTDADVDGAHITTLLLTFLYRYMTDLIEDGYVYMARPPLYKVSWGKNFEYTYTEEDKDLIIKKVRENNPNKEVKFGVQRYKGLGEMNPEQLWETTMNPDTRMLYQVTIGEAEQANKVFDELMGSEVAPRKKFIEENAQFVEVEMI